MAADLSELWQWLSANAREDLPESFPERGDDGLPLDGDDDVDEQLEGVDYAETAVQLVPVSYRDSPSEREALVHFTYDPEAVAVFGLLGTPDPKQLGLTHGVKKTERGFNFAYQALSDSALASSRGGALGEHYGDVAYVFHAPHILVRHRGDKDEQAIFLGADLDPSSAPTLRYTDAWADDDFDDEEGPASWLVHAPGCDEPCFGPATWTEAVEEAVRLLNGCEPAVRPKS